MHIRTEALVLREVDYKETDKILTLLTPAGRRTAKARGVRRKGSQIAASCQLFAFSEMELFEYRGKCSVNEAESKELFFGLRADVADYSLAAYFMELLETAVGEDEQNPAALALALNSLYALNKLDRPRALVKAAFELRLLSLAGFEPMLDCCGVCGISDPAQPRLQLEEGVLVCDKCRKAAGIAVKLCPASLRAMRYVLSAQSSRIFSFALGGEALERLGNAVEAFLCVQFERGFGTLDFYKKLIAVENTDDPV